MEVGLAPVIMTEEEVGLAPVIMTEEKARWESSASTGWIESRKETEMKMIQEEVGLFVFVDCKWSNLKTGRFECCQHLHVRVL